MTKFNYKATFLTREATESRIEQIDRQIKELATVPGNVLSYTTVRDMANNLSELKSKLEADLKYFDAIDRAMAEAVK